MKASPKRIEISVEFTSYERLEDALKKIVADAQQNNESDNVHQKGYKYKWWQEFVIKTEPIKEVVVDGKIIQTFNSKMNRTA